VGLQAIPLSFLLLTVIALLPALANDIQQEIQYSLVSQSASSSVLDTARLVTVRILSSSSAGSGVIIERRGSTYTILTNAHVVAAASAQPYSILTSDGETHAGRWLQSAQFDEQDLALVQFTSDRAYQVVAIGDSDALSIGEPVYAAGFPNWRLLSSNTLEETQSWGPKALQVTAGQVGMILGKPLQQGYQLGYTNQIEPGMSGGPVLNQYGQLIAINGGLKYPLQGIIAFIFADGSLPSGTLFQQMETLSWAIPIATFQRSPRQLKS